MRSKSRAGDYWTGGRATFRDILHSLLPYDENQFLPLIFGLVVCGMSIQYFNFSHLLHFSFNNFGDIMFFLSFITVCLHVTCMILWFMMCDLFFLTQRVMLTIFTILWLSNVWISVQNNNPQVDFSILLVNAFWFFFMGIKGRNRLGFFKFGTSRNMRPTGFPPRKEGRHRIVFIEPASGIEKSRYHSRFYFYPSVLPMVAATVPDDWDIMLLDDVHNEIDYDMDVDIVGITTMSVYYSRACVIAKEFKARGKTVIFGGPDASLVPENYLPLGDSVLVGEAYGFIPKMLDDWKSGNLQNKYLNKEYHSLENLPLPRNDLLPKRRYLNMHNILVSTSCPFACEYCTYAKGKSARLRPINELIEAIKHADAQFYWFEAPELLIYKPYVKKLGDALEGMNLHWVAHASMKSCSDIENLNNARRAGLRQVMLGVESFNQDVLKFANKRTNTVADYLTVFKMLDRAGIVASANIMFGFPQDKPEDYMKGLEILIKGKVASMFGHRLCVYPGDEAFEMKLLAAGGRPMRVFEILNADKRLNFTPYRSNKYSDIEYDQYVETFFKEFHSFRSIFRRLFFRSARNIPNLIPDLFSSLMAKFRSTDGSQQNYNSYFDYLDLMFELKSGEARRIALSLPPEKNQNIAVFETGKMLDVSILPPSNALEAEVATQLSLN